MGTLTSTFYLVTTIKKLTYYKILFLKETKYANNKLTEPVSKKNIN